ncbi:hypothetical protein [Paenibacillus tuaregi]|uniref:hypothetical protein n=1 Tax=Paenibacillus tuaregi TaxID=1816681 RepID=UPI0008385DF1|nr:hypothetical protein [Paenibacillus tuaregi]
MSKLNVQLNANYRLTTDGTQFILKQRKLVDPTKAPGYKPEPGVPSPELRETWPDAGYYSYTPGGLSALINHVVIASAADSDTEELTEFTELIRAESERLAEAINAGFKREITVKLGA